MSSTLSFSSSSSTVSPLRPSDSLSSDSSSPPISGPQSLHQLELTGVIGFNGKVPHGLILHPGDNHLLYPLGSTIVIRHLLSNNQYFLRGHDSTVSCLALSSSGKYLASGQQTHMGFTAQVIIWDMETYEIVHRLHLHKGKIQDCAFSPNEKFLATLGGRDDNKLILWDVTTGQAICGSTAANETTNTVRFFNHSDYSLVTGGHYNLRVWSFDLANRKIRPTDCQLGQLKRIIHSITIDEADEYMYCGSASGDLLQVSLTHSLFKASGPVNKPFQLGITCTMRTRKGNYVVGSGDGTIAVIKKDDFKVVRKTKVSGGITSLVLNAAGDHFFVGTSECNVYLVKLDNFDLELRNTCHWGRINCVAFPSGFSELFATASNTDIRVWNARNRNELLRIQVPNVNCTCIAFMPDGKSIVSGWEDGKIRAFGPQTGKLLYCINDAHVGGVTAIACTDDCKRLVSGGENGQVRVWSIEKSVQKMIASMKEHKGKVSRIVMNNDSSECVSASSDGSCIVWSLQRFVRHSALFASTQFRAVVYHPDQSQLLTTGTDRKLSYWDVTDGSPIRIIDGSPSDSLNTLAISGDGSRFVCGGGDKAVKVWLYDEGICYSKGIGHSGEISAVAIAPDQRSIVSTGEEGAIFIWKMPDAPRGEEEEEEEGEEEGEEGEASYRSNYSETNGLNHSMGKLKMGMEESKEEQNSNRTTHRSSGGKKQISSRSSRR